MRTRYDRRPDEEPKGPPRILPPTTARLLLTTGDAWLRWASGAGRLHAPGPRRAAELDRGGRLQRGISPLTTFSRPAGSPARHVSWFRPLRRLRGHAGRARLCPALVLDGPGAGVGLRRVWGAALDPV